MLASPAIWEDDTSHSETTAAAEPHGQARFHRSQMPAKRWHRWRAPRAIALEALLFEALLRYRA